MQCSNTTLRLKEGKRDFRPDRNAKGRGEVEEGGWKRPARRPLFSFYKHPPDKC